jgi:hypothetical protein
LIIYMFADGVQNIFILLNHPSDIASFMVK